MIEYIKDATALVMILMMGACVLVLGGCNLPSSNSFEYIGVHECDPSRTIPAAPTEPKALCIFTEKPQ